MINPLNYNNYLIYKDFLTPSYNNNGYYSSIQTSNQPYQKNNEEQAVKTLGMAALLQVISSGLQKCSKILSDKFSAAQEFTDGESVVKVAQNMVDKNKLNIHVGFIDDFNKISYIRRYGLASNFETVAKGRNAFFVDKLRLAVAPKNKPSLILHELGHAINAKNVFTKVLQKTQKYAGYAPMAILLAHGYLANKKDGKEDFVEKHAGILGFCAFLPTIIEEGIASCHGIKAAKDVLRNPSTLKILKRNYALAWGTYLLAGIGLGVAAKGTVVRGY